MAAATHMPVMFASIKARSDMRKGAISAIALLGLLLATRAIRGEPGYKFAVRIVILP
jgi:hypothetical protein